MDIPIVYEDEILLVIDKPPGLVVNRAQSVKGDTVQDWIEATRPLTALGNEAIQYQDFVQRTGIVHRIDKETSGLLLIAKSPGAFSTLQEMFQSRSIHKTYAAIVHGILSPAQGEINAPVGRLPWNRMRFGILATGKSASTSYRSLAAIQREGQGYTFVEVQPQTGRTHQIRVHLSSMKHPILGDQLYAGRKTSRTDKLWVNRMMLHAWKLVLTHPQTSQPLAFVAPIPDDMNEVLKYGTR